MTTPYTYLIGWTKLNRFYYGVRFRKGCSPEDLWATYFTSSKAVKTLRETIGEPDIIEIRKTFNDPERAREWEHKVLRRMRVSGSERWLNKTDGRSIPASLGDANASRDPMVREKISKALTGRKRPDVAERNRALKGKGVIGAKFGHRHSEETKNKQAAARASFLETPKGHEQRQKSR
jgi:hypothetical protein